MVILTAVEQGKRQEAMLLSVDKHGEEGGQNVTPPLSSVYVASDPRRLGA